MRATERPMPACGLALPCLACLALHAMRHTHRISFFREFAAKMLAIMLVLLSGLPAALGFATHAPRPHAVSRSSSHERAPICIAAANKKKPSKKSSSSLDFGSTGSTDADGYRRGSFGIGETESIVIWAVVGAALVFGGALDDETAKKIGDAQRSFYPQPPGFDEAVKLKAKTKITSSTEIAPLGFPQV